MKEITHPRDLPPFYREQWEERAAIMQEGCKLPTDRAGTAQANRRAFEDILRVMERDEDATFRGQSHGRNKPSVGRHLGNR